MMRKRAPWLKAHSTPATMKWLERNYQSAVGGCVPRNALYREYVEFCRLNEMQPVNAASFGKIIRKKFPNLKTRRLGTRGQSKYHYYGLTTTTFGFQSVAGVSTDARLDHDRTTIDGAIKMDKGHQILQLTDVLKNLNAPQFPSREIFGCLAKRPLRENLETVLELYTAHCKRIFEMTKKPQTHPQVCEEIKDFWNGFPTQLMPFLHNNSVVSLIAACDTILYYKIGLTQNYFQPKSTSPPYENCKQMVQLAASILTYTSVAIQSQNDNISQWKLKLAKQFLTNVKALKSLEEIYCKFQTYIEEDKSHMMLIMDSNQLNVGLIAKEVTPKILSRLDLTVNFQKDIQNIIFSSLCELLDILKSKMKSQVLKCILLWSQKITRDICNITSKRAFVSRESNMDHIQVDCPKQVAVRHYLVVWSILGESILNMLEANAAKSYAIFEAMYFLLKQNSEHILRSIACINLIGKLVQTVVSGENNLETLWDSIDDSLPIRVKTVTEINSTVSNSEYTSSDIHRHHTCSSEPLWSSVVSCCDNDMSTISNINRIIKFDEPKVHCSISEEFVTGSTIMNDSIYFENNPIPCTKELQFDTSSMSRPFNQFMQIQFTENEELEEFQRTIDSMASADIIASSIAANENLHVNHLLNHHQTNPNMESEIFPHIVVNQSEQNLLGISSDQQSFPRHNYYRHQQSPQHSTILEQNCQISCDPNFHYGVSSVQLPS